MYYSTAFATLQFFFSFTIVIKCACLFHKCLGQYQECLGVFLHQRFSSTLVVSRDGPIGIPSSNYTCNGCWYWLLLLGTAQTSHSLRLQGMRGFFGPSKCPVVMQLLFSWDLHQAWPVMLTISYRDTSDSAIGVISPSQGSTLQSIMNAKLSQHRFWHCHKNRLIKTIQTIPHNLYASFKSASLY